MMAEEGRLSRVWLKPCCFFRGKAFFNLRHGSPLPSFYIGLGLTQTGD